MKNKKKSRRKASNRSTPRLCDKPSQKKLAPTSLLSKTNPTVVLFLLCVFLIAIGLWVVDAAGKKINTLSLGYIAFFLGSIWELYRITVDWNCVLKTVLGALGFSLLNFFPYDDERSYSLQNHLDNWPVAFALGFILIVVVFFEDKLIPVLAEGVTLLHSIALSYWLLDLYNSGKTGPMWLLLCAIPVLFSAAHAFTDITLSKNDRLWLSIWSSVVMAIFGVNYVTAVVQMENIESLLVADMTGRGSYVFLECFLLGASGAYIAQNLCMLIGFLPGKYTFFNAQYFREIKELSTQHIDRYCDKQVDKTQALLVTVVCGVWLGSNILFNFVSRDFAVWVTLVLIPLFIACIIRVPTLAEDKDRQKSIRKT